MGPGLRRDDKSIHPLGDSRFLRAPFRGSDDILLCTRAQFGSCLSQRELAIAVRYDCLAALAELGVAAAVAHDPADLFPLDIAVDAGHPRVDLGEQQALARRNDVVGPASGTRCGGLDTSEAAVAREADQPGRPIGAVLGGARKVAEPGMG